MYVLENTGVYPISQPSGILLSRTLHSSVRKTLDIWREPIKAMESKACHPYKHVMAVSLCTRGCSMFEIMVV